MSIDTAWEKEMEDAVDKSVEALSEYLEAGVIIGTYIDADGATQKYAKPWGNEFAASKIVEVQHQENEMANAIVLGQFGDD